MTSPTITTVTQAVVDRLVETLHRRNGGPCAEVKIYGGELEQLVEVGETMAGWPAIWVQPARSAEEPIGTQLVKVILHLSIWIAVGNLYGTEAQLMGKGSAIGAAGLLDLVRVRLWSQRMGMSIRALQPEGWDVVLEAMAGKVPVTVYQYHWTTRFETECSIDDDGLPVVETLQAGIYTPPDADDPVLELVTELEEN